jgi:hypothetical protein
VGGADRAGAENDLVGLDRRDLTAAPGDKPRGTRPLEHDALDLGFGHDGEIRAGPSGMNVTDRRAPAVAVEVVRGERTDARRIRGVEILALLKPLLAARFEERQLGSEPLLARPAADRDRAAGAMIRRPDVAIVLQLAEERENLLEAPGRVASRRPGVEILRDAPQEHLAVDGAGATHHLAARHQPEPRFRRVPPDEAPGVVARHGVRRRDETVPNLVGYGLQRLEVRAGLDQQDRATGILRQSRGNNRAR